ncbi:MAG TPA: hypothetical protein PKX56_06440 [Marmoricola sp.]|nr:hypothetical protein [Marmoricola sp.]HNI70897.1 hypothetical protein [Marmoricola sp.]HNJ78975.1 hypothetical protein [Marmoricola sp.]
MTLLNYVLITIALVAVLLATVTWWLTRRRMRELLVAQTRQIEMLRGELTGLAHRLEQAESVTEQIDEAVLITRIGEGTPEVEVPDRIVLSATLGEPIVKSAAFFHGLRRALAPESRNRIRFEMKREVRRARKQRRQDMKDAYRQLRRENLAESRTA